MNLNAPSDCVACGVALHRVTACVWWWCCTECLRRVRLVPFGSFGVAAAAVGFGLGRFLRFPSDQMMIVAV